MDNARYMVQMGDEADPVPQGDPSVRSLEAIGALIRSKHYQSFLADHIMPRLKAKQNQLASEKDLIEMYRLQGAIGELERLTNLSKVRTGIRNSLKSHGKEEE